MDATISVFLFIAVNDILQSFNNPRNGRSREATGKVTLRSPLNYSLIRFGRKSGHFSASGFQTLSREVHEYIWNELKPGDELRLIPDPDNEADPSAIKIIFRNRHIGWFRGDFREKTDLYKALVSGKPVKAMCISNIRGPEYRRSGEEVRFQGLRQFVKGRYEYWKY